jgi:excisionase family DNA binding protein
MARKSSLTSPAKPSLTATPLPITLRLVTIKQAAAYCSCSVWAIRDVIWSRELRACMIGRRYLIDRGDLDRFIDARLRGRE